MKRIRVDREFACELSQVSHRGQTKTHTSYLKLKLQSTQVKIINIVIFTKILTRMHTFSYYCHFAPYLQHERPCCVGCTNLGRRREFFI